MALSLVTAPATEPITLAEAKAHLRLDSAPNEPAPTAPTVALASPAAAGSVDNGAHRYRATFVTADGETDGGAITAAVTVVDKNTNGKVELTAIPTGDPAVTSRKIYRTTAGGTSYLLLTTIANNTATTYTDNTADSALGAALQTAIDDPLVNSLITTARMMAEQITRRALITQTWDLKLDGFPANDAIWLPFPPLSSVTSVTYTDTAGAAQTWALTTGYLVDAPAGPAPERGKVYPAYGVPYPSTRDVPNAVVVRFIAGYGEASAVPEPIKSAMKLIIGHLYANRENVVITDRGSIVQEMPQAAEYTLWPYRDYRWS